jgi:hypothetical protein
VMSCDDHERLFSTVLGHFVLPRMTAHTSLAPS